MNGNKQPYALLIFGVPMSGKTEFATKFSKQFKAPLLNLAELPGIPRKSFLSLIKNVAISEQTLIVEGGLDTGRHRAEIARLLSKAGYRPVLIWVQTDVKAVKQRLKVKLKSIDAAKKYFDERIEQLEAPADAERAIVISGKHTFATQLKTTLAGLAAR